MNVTYRLFVICCAFFLARVSAARDFEVDFGADGYVKGFSKDKNVNTPQNKDQGFAQLLRARVDFMHKEGIALKTRTVLSGDRWDGDTPVSNTSVKGVTDNGGGGNDVRLDYGFLEYKKEDWTFAAGRQVANWAQCLTTCDDRRDRLLVMKNIGGLYAAFVYDKRMEGTIDRDIDDGDMYSILLMKFDQDYEAGLLAAYWVNADGTYVLGGAWNFSPYIKYRWGAYRFNLLANWIGWGEDTSWFSGQHHVYVAQVERDLGAKFKIEAQALHTYAGGYLSTGFDTYLSMVNTNPDHNQSHIQAARIGGFGTFTGGKDQNETLYSARLSYEISSDWSVSVAGGAFTLYELANTREVDLWALDAVAAYKLSSNATIKGSLGRIMGDYGLSAGALALAASF